MARRIHRIMGDMVITTHIPTRIHIIIMAITLTPIGVGHIGVGVAGAVGVGAADGVVVAGVVDGAAAGTAVAVTAVVVAEASTAVIGNRWLVFRDAGLRKQACVFFLFVRGCGAENSCSPSNPRLVKKYRT
jgi:hypothetical protein